MRSHRSTGNPKERSSQKRFSARSSVGSSSSRLSMYNGVDTADPAEFEMELNRSQPGYAINKDALEKLKRVFDAAAKEGSEGLASEEFVPAFGKVLGSNLSEQQLQHLFMKIDANSDGTVDWEEFTNFLLMETQGVSEMAEGMFTGVKRCPDKAIQTQHSEMITAMCKMANDFYLTVARDGTLRLWAPRKLKCVKTVHYRPYESAPKRNPWLVAVVYLERSNLIGVAASDCTVLFYDASTLEAVCRMHDTQNYRQLEHTPTCMETAFLSGEEILLVGDDAGRLSVYRMQPGDWHMCDGRGGLTCKHMDLELHRTNIHLVTLPNLHSNWITCVRYIPPLASLVSCSLDTTVKLAELYMPGVSFLGLAAAKTSTANAPKLKTLSRPVLKRVFRGHRKSVYCFAYCSSQKFIVSCGQERELILWDPYTCQIVTRLSGHSASISHVVIHDRKHAMISLDTAKVLRVWDVRTLNCLQTVADEQHYRPEDRVADVLFDDDRRQLVTATTRVHVWKVKPKPFGGKLSHDKPVCAALYNHNFHQVVSADTSGQISVWDVETGSSVFRYFAGFEMSALAFDHYGRRLLTGGPSGDLKLWNFSSGDCLMDFKKRKGSRRGIDADEITAVVYVHTQVGNQTRKYACAVGWDHKVTLWQESQNAKKELMPLCTMPVEGDPGHEADILSATACGNFFASGDSAGVIFVWHLESASVHRRLFMPSDVVQRAVEQLVWLPKQEVLVSAGADGFLRFWDMRRGLLLFHHHCGCEANESVVAMSVDHTSSVLICGDTNGDVCTFEVHDIVQDEDGKLKQEEESPPFVTGLHRWNAHTSTIRGVQYFRHPKHELPLVITASTDHTVRLWTADGRFIGMFGRKRRWNLENEATWGGTRRGHRVKGRFQKAVAEPAPVEAEAPEVITKLSIAVEEAEEKKGAEEQQPNSAHVQLSPRALGMLKELGVDLRSVCRPRSPREAATLPVSDWCLRRANSPQDPIGALRAARRRKPSARAVSPVERSPQASSGRLMLKPRPIEWVPQDPERATRASSDSEEEWAIGMYSKKSEKYHRRTTKE